MFDSYFKKQYGKNRHLMEDNSQIPINSNIFVVGLIIFTYSFFKNLGL